MTNKKLGSSNQVSNSMPTLEWSPSRRNPKFLVVESTFEKGSRTRIISTTNKVSSSLSIKLSLPGSRHFRKKFLAF
jgi:hypothetical protein